MTAQQLLPIGMHPDEGARAALGGVSRPTIYRLIDQGHLVRVTIGRRAFITASSITDYIDRLTSAARITTMSA